MEKKDITKVIQVEDLLDFKKFNAKDYINLVKRSGGQIFQHYSLLDSYANYLGYGEDGSGFSASYIETEVTFSREVYKKRVYTSVVFPLDTTEGIKSDIIIPKEGSGSSVKSYLRAQISPYFFERSLNSAMFLGGAFRNVYKRAQQEPESFMTTDVEFDVSFMTGVIRAPVMTYTSKDPENMLTTDVILLGGKLKKVLLKAQQPIESFKSDVEISKGVHSTMNKIDVTELNFQSKENIDISPRTKSEPLNEFSTVFEDKGTYRGVKIINSLGGIKTILRDDTSYAAPHTNWTFTIEFTPTELKGSVIFYDTRHGNYIRLNSQDPTDLEINIGQYIATGPQTISTFSTYRVTVEHKNGELFFYLNSKLLGKRLFNNGIMGSGDYIFGNYPRGGGGFLGFISDFKFIKNQTVLTDFTKRYTPITPLVASHLVVENGQIVEKNSHVNWEFSQRDPQPTEDGGIPFTFTNYAVAKNAPDTSMYNHNNYAIEVTAKYTVGPTLVNPYRILLHKTGTLEPLRRGNSDYLLGFRYQDDKTKVYFRVGDVSITSGISVPPNTPINIKAYKYQDYLLLFVNGIAQGQSKLKYNLEEDLVSDLILGRYITNPNYDFQGELYELKLINFFRGDFNQLGKYLPENFSYSSVLNFEEDLIDEADARRLWNVKDDSISPISKSKSKFGEYSLASNQDLTGVHTKSGPTFNFENKDFTVEMWINPSEYSSDAILFSNDADLNENTKVYSTKIKLTEDGKIALVANKLFTGLEKDEIIVSNNRVPLNVWSHIAVSRENGQFFIHMNGAKEAANISNGLYLDFSIEGTTIGAKIKSNGNFKGYIDSFRAVKDSAMYSKDTYNIPTRNFGSSDTSVITSLSFDKDFNLTSDEVLLRFSKNKEISEVTSWIGDLSKKENIFTNTDNTIKEIRDEGTVLNITPDDGLYKESIFFDGDSRRIFARPFSPIFLEGKEGLKVDVDFESGTLYSKLPYNYIYPSSGILYHTKDDRKVAYLRGHYYRTSLKFHRPVTDIMQTGNFSIYFEFLLKESDVVGDNTPSPVILQCWGSTVLDNKPDGDRYGGFHFGLSGYQFNLPNLTSPRNEYKNGELSIDTWHSFFLSYKDNKFTFILDGVVEKDSVPALFPSNMKGKLLTIFRASEDYGAAHGYLDNIKFFDRGYSAQEVLTPGPLSSLIPSFPSVEKEDFTFEIRLKFSQSTTDAPQVVFSSDALDNQETSFNLVRTPINYLAMYTSKEFNSPALLSEYALENNEWYSVAIVREKGIFKLFIDGIHHSTTTKDVSFSKSLPVIGGAFSLNYNGFVAGVRMTKGVALYSNSYIPDGKPYEKTTSRFPVVIENPNEIVEESLDKVIYSLEGKNSKLVSEGSYEYLYSSIKDNSTSVRMDTRQYDLNFSNSDFTLEFKFKTILDKQFAVFYSHHYTWGEITDTYTNRNVINGVRFRLGDLYLESRSNAFSRGEWCTVTVTRERDTFRLFINGELHNELERSISIPVGSYFYLGWGNSSGEIHFDSFYINANKAVRPSITFDPSKPLYPSNLVDVELSIPPDTKYEILPSNSYIENIKLEDTPEKVRVVNSNKVKRYSAKFSTGNYLKLNNFPSMPSNFEVDFWVYLLEDDANIFHISQGSNGYISLNLVDNFFSVKILSTNSFTNNYTDSTYFVSLNKWHKIRLTHKNGKLFLYVNGDLVFTKEQGSSSYFQGEVGSMYLGYDPNNESTSNMYLDSFKISKLREVEPVGYLRYEPFEELIAESHTEPLDLKPEMSYLKWKKEEGDFEITSEGFFQIHEDHNSCIVYQDIDLRKYYNFFQKNIYIAFATENTKKANNGLMQLEVIFLDKYKNPIKQITSDNTFNYSAGGSTSLDSYIFDKFPRDCSYLRLRVKLKNNGSIGNFRVLSEPLPILDYQFLREEVTEVSGERIDSIGYMYVSYDSTAGVFEDTLIKDVSIGSVKESENNSIKLRNFTAKASYSKDAFGVGNVQR